MTELSQRCDARQLFPPNSRIPVALAQLAEETRCPVCFGILNQPVTSMVCLHRFCAACIETCLAGRPPQHKDCPVCRANLHSRRFLRPDHNLDRLLKALYGDVAVYGKEEDALVAANVAARAREAAAAEEAQLRAQQRAAQEAARHQLDPHYHHYRQQAAARAAVDMARQSSDEGHPQAAPAPPAAAGSCHGNGKRSRGEGAGANAAGVAPGAPAAKRREHTPPPLAARAALPARLPPAVAPAPLSRQASARAAPAASSPHGGGRPGAHSGAAAAAAHRHASEAKDGSGGGVPPRGPLAVPTGRSAAELSLCARTPGLVLLQLQPAPSHGVQESGPSPGCASGRLLQAPPPPPLQKPFLLCPSKWTVAHVAQLLSQWLPPRGHGPFACPVAAADIRLQPAPGLLRGSHRCLRGCTGLGALAAEVQEGGGCGGGDGEQPYKHLVLLYSVAPPAS